MYFRVAALLFFFNQNFKVGSGLPEPQQGVSCGAPQDADGNFLCQAAFGFVDEGIDFDATFFCAANATLDNSTTAILEDYDCRCNAEVTLASGEVISSCGCGACPVGSLNSFAIDCGDQVILSVPGHDCTSFACDGLCNAPIDIDDGGPEGNPATNAPTGSSPPTVEPVPNEGVHCTPNAGSNDEFTCTSQMRVLEAGTNGTDLWLYAQFECLSEDSSSSLNVLTADCGCEAWVEDSGTGETIYGCSCGACSAGSDWRFGIDCGSEVVSVWNGVRNCTSFGCNGFCNEPFDVDQGGPTLAPSTASPTTVVFADSASPGKSLGKVAIVVGSLIVALIADF